MANRGMRGSVADMYASRQAGAVDDVEDEHIPDDADDDEPIIEEPEPQDVTVDYSHDDDESDDDPDGDADADEPTDDGLTDLQRQLSELQGQNEALQRQLAGAETAEMQGNQAIVQSGLAQARQNLATAEAEYEAAAKAGEWGKAGKAQTKIAEAALDVREFQNAADEIERALKNPPKRQPQRQAQQPTDGFEAAIKDMAPEAQAWCRTNKADLTKSPSRYQHAVTGHHLAVESGLKPNTPKYFDYLDKHMGYEVATKKNGGGNQPAQQQRRQPRPTGQPRVAAPGGSRSAPNGGGGVGDVKLSRAEVDAAKAMGMTLKRYAQHKQEIIKNGKDPSRGGPAYTHQSPGNRR